MRLHRYCLIALLMVPGLTLARHAAADAIGVRIGTTLSASRISSKSATNRLDEREKDEREKDQALQTAAKKSEPEVSATQREQAASDAMRAKKTRNVVSGQ